MTQNTQLTKMLRGCGFDWLLIDCEQTPNSEADVLAKLQALNGSATMPRCDLPTLTWQRSNAFSTEVHKL